jgi:hypothetical protein
VIDRVALVGPSAHLENTQRVSVVAGGAWALMEHAEPVAQFSVTGVAYAPAGHPVPLTEKLVAMLLSKRTPVAMAAKVAVIDLGAFIVTVTGF